MGNKRVGWIDIAKGIGIILVVLGHVVASYREASLYTDNGLFIFSSQFVYSFHMALFMLLSGHLCSMGRQNRDTGKRIRKLIINYGIPYVLFSALWGLMKIMFASHTNSAVSWKDLALIPVYPISFMWFIYALLIMQVLQVLVEYRSTKFKAIHLIFAAGGYFVRPYLVEVLDTINFSDCVLNDVLRVYIFFLIGVYCGQWILNRLENREMVTAVLSGIVLIAGNILSFLYGVPSTMLYSFAIALIGSLFVIALSQMIGKSSVLSYCGRNSLPIYVLQGFAISGTRLVLTHFRLNGQTGIAPLVICTIAGCVLSLTAHLISKKIWKLEACFYPGKYIK